MEKKIDYYLYKNSDDKNSKKYVDINRSLSNFNEDDWTFKTANTKELTHSIFNDYPARMIPQIARRLISLYYPKYRDPNKKKPILDPFAGSGTTCVEAMISDIESVAFDLNPLSQLITKVRTTIISYEKLRKNFLKFTKLLEKNQDKIYKQYFPDDPNLDYWYNEKVLQKLSVLCYVIDELFPKEDDLDLKCVRNIFLLCLAKVGRICSYQRSGEHKSYRIPKSKISDFDKNVEPLSHFKRIFKTYVHSLGDLFDLYNSNNISVSCRTILGNSMELNGIDENSIDLIITSPPYGDSHTTVAYGQFSRFPLEWTQSKYSKIKNIDSSLLGGIKKNFNFVESSQLLNISKKILIEEMQQQNNILTPTIENIKNYLKADSNLELINALLLSINRIIKFEKKVSKIDNFKELVKLKDYYFSEIKKIRKSLLDIRNKLKTSDNDLKFFRLKVLDERLPFVLAFFSDLYNVLKRLYYVLDFNRKCCIVIGNRTVKRIKIPSDEIIVEIGKIMGFEHIKSYYREIPNKRMPRKNSPTNIKGEILSTMNSETIIILNKPKQ